MFYHVLLSVVLLIGAIRADGLIDYNKSELAKLDVYVNELSKTQDCTSLVAYLNTFGADGLKAIKEPPNLADPMEGGLPAFDVGPKKSQEEGFKEFTQKMAEKGFDHKYWVADSEAWTFNGKEFVYDLLQKAGGKLVGDLKATIKLINGRIKNRDPIVQATIAQILTATNDQTVTYYEQYRKTREGLESANQKAGKALQKRKKLEKVQLILGLVSLITMVLPVAGLGLRGLALIPTFAAMATRGGAAIAAAEAAIPFGAKMVGNTAFFLTDTFSVLPINQLYRPKVPALDKEKLKKITTRSLPQHINEIVKVADALDDVKVGTSAGKVKDPTGNVMDVIKDAGNTYLFKYAAGNYGYYTDNGGFYKGKVVTEPMFNTMQSGCSLGNVKPSENRLVYQCQQKTFTCMVTGNGNKITFYDCIVEGINSIAVKACGGTSACVTKVRDCVKNGGLPQAKKGEDQRKGGLVTLKMCFKEKGVTIS